jgi:hypothetical protein
LALSFTRNENDVSDTTHRAEVAFISGHLDLSEEEFAAHYQARIDEASARGCSFIVGDARGADLLFQRYAAQQGLRTTVFHMLETPRHNAGNFACAGGFTSDKTRDEAMTAASTFDIAWVRPGRESSGTAKNLTRRSR